MPSNEYYDNAEAGQRFQAGTTARGSDVDAKLDAVQTGFDKLPTESELKEGTANYATDTGTADAYVVALPYAPVAYAVGLEVKFKATAANTGASTINVNALGVKSIVRPDSSALEADDIAASSLAVARYNGTAFQLDSAYASTTAAAVDAASAATSAANAATSETNAGTSETNAAASASAASTSASNAATSETNAGTSETNAATSASNASTSETNAATSESNASGSESAASTSETNAATSETNAAASAAAALGSQLAAANYAFWDARTKAEFFAQAEANKATYAGSGFVEWGTHRNTPVNQGLYDVTTVSNLLRMGEVSAPAGTSRTNHPVVQVNGVMLAIREVRSGSAERSDINFPEAPTATQLVTNGTFDTDTSGWNSGANGQLTVDTNRLKITNGAASSGYAEQGITTVVGQTYLVEVEVTASTATDHRLAVGSTSGAVDLMAVYSGGASMTLRGEFTATGTTSYLILQNYDATDTRVAFYDNVSVIDKADISRQDLVFLEVWHEQIAGKDFIYPYGNVQFGATTFDGVSLVNNTVAAGYSAVGAWESSPTAGYGAVWSTLSDADKQKFVAELYNNVYLDDDGSLVQVRYRVRVVQGLGDDWKQVDPQGNDYYRYSVNGYVKAQGQNTTAVDLSTTFDSDFLFSGSASDSNWQKDAGAWGVKLTSTVGLDAQVWAVPIALVQRRNQGAFHPVFNPYGCSAFVQVSGGLANGSSAWYASGNTTANSTADCFAPFIEYNQAAAVDGLGRYAQTGGNQSGSIASGSSHVKHPAALYYDAIYAADVKDLRFSAHKIQDYHRQLEREFRRLVAGEIRGWEGERSVKRIASSVTHTSAAYSSSSRYMRLEFTANTFSSEHNRHTSGSLIRGRNSMKAVGFLRGNTTGTIWVLNEFYVNEAAMDRLYVNEEVYGDQTTAFNAEASFDVWVVDDYTSTAGQHCGETILQCDIIGDPANYPQEWEDHGVFGTPLLIDDAGNSTIIASGTASVKFSRKVETNLTYVVTSDAGATWTSGTLTADSTTNDMTFDDRVYLAFYLTSANPTSVTTNRKAVATRGRGWASNSYTASLGALLGDWLIGKVPVGTPAPFSKEFPITSEALESRDTNNRTYVVSADYYPQHDSIGLDTAGAAVPAVKVLPYLGNPNDRAVLQLIFKEIRYSTVFGDDGLFDVIDNENFAVDDNTEVVAVGQRLVELPFLISDKE